MLKRIITTIQKEDSNLVNHTNTSRKNFKKIKIESSNLLNIGSTLTDIMIELQRSNSNEKEDLSFNENIFQNENFID